MYTSLCHKSCKTNNHHYTPQCINYSCTKNPQLQITSDIEVAYASSLTKHAQDNIHCPVSLFMSDTMTAASRKSNKATVGTVTSEKEGKFTMESQNLSG